MKISANKPEARITSWNWPFFVKPHVQVCIIKLHRNSTSVIEMSLTCCVIASSFQQVNVSKLPFKAGGGIPGVNEAHDKELRLLLHSHFACWENGKKKFFFFSITSFGMSIIVPWALPYFCLCVCCICLASAFVSFGLYRLRSVSLLLKVLFMNRFRLSTLVWFLCYGSS